jgi:hypothetical protein
VCRSDDQESGNSDRLETASFRFWGRRSKFLTSSKFSGEFFSARTILVEKIVNERLALVLRHLVPFEAALRADTSKLPFRVLHPLLAPLWSVRGQCEQRRAPTLWRQLFHQIHHLRVAQLENRHRETSTDYCNKSWASGRSSFRETVPRFLIPAMAFPADQTT